MARKRTGEEIEEEEVPYDDVEEEEEEEEEEDDDVRPAKRKYNPFIDEMAIVNDEDDEEEDDDDYSREDGFIEEETADLPSATDIQRRHLDLDRRRREVEDMDDEEIAAIFTKRYGGKKNQAFKSSQDVPQQLLLPSVSDPNLWVVKCKPGKEKDVIFGMMKRYFDRQYSDRPLETFSAFAKDSLKGYIYIEGRRQAHVQQTIANIPFIYQSSLNLVPIKEMVDSINIVRQEKEIPMGGWVRVKRGKYTGDLGQVLELSDGQDSALIKLVPRLDLDPPKGDDALGQRKKAGASATSRPAQKMFNPEKLSKHVISSLQKKGPYWVFNGDHFRDGYLEKRMKIATLQIGNVNPTLDEIAKFAGDNELNPEDGERTLDLATLSVQSVNDVSASALFQNGDAVEVIEGDLIHSTGTVVSISDSSVMVSLNVDGFNKQVSFPPRHIRKLFKEGDHVKVVHGRFKDESGMIVNVKDNIVTILSDATLKEVKVFAKDLREAMDVSFGKTTIGEYELHDLVQLDFHTVGVITKVDRNSFRIITQNSTERTVEPHQITHKHNSNKAVATDAAGNSIRAGDSVVEVGGEKRNCNILHIYRNLVFLHSRENAENYGVWVLPTRQVINVAAQNSKSLATQDISKQQPYGPGMGRGGNLDARGRGRGARGGFYGRGRGGRDNLVSKTVRIAHGPHKGYVGIVKDTTDTTARVELHTNCKIINVEKSKLVLVDSRGGIIGPAVDSNERFGRNDFSSAATPRRYGEGSMTPSHYGLSGSKTPAWNSSARTPNPYAMDGSKTPAWDVGSKTPNPHAFQDGSKTPAWDSGSKTPMWNSSSSAKTPGFADSGSKTPTWNRYNDNDIAPTPAAHALSAQTPAASYHVAPSPAPYPQTPAVNFAQTPYDHAATPYDSAPTPGASLIPATPAALSAPTPAAHMLSAPTPGSYIPATPAALQAQTPFIPSGGDYSQMEENSADTSTEWPIEEIEIKLLKSVGDAQEGQIGSIISIQKNSRTCSIQLYEPNNRVDSVSYEVIEPVRPSKKDHVKIMLGDNRGDLGSLIGVDSHDGIVRIKGGGGGFKIMSMGSVGKYTGTEDVM